jgi:hypothetical protein
MADAVSRLTRRSRVKIVVEEEEEEVTVVVVLVVATRVGEGAIKAAVTVTELYLGL